MRENSLTVFRMDRKPLVDVANFVGRCDAVATARRISRARMSIILLNDSRAIDRLADRGGLTVSSLNKAHEKLSDMEAELVAKAAKASVTE